MIRYAITLDESGDFSRSSGSNLPNFIGGLIYKYASNDAGDYDNTKKYIWQRLQALCDEKFIDFPGGLHSTKNTYHRHILNDIFFNIIRELNASREAVTPFLIVQHDSNTLYKFGDNIVNDSAGANLYENMLSYALNLLLSSLPNESDEDISIWLDIPTRIHVVTLPEHYTEEDKKRFDKAIRFFDNAGYERLETIADGKHEVRYSIVREAILRMVIKNWVMQSGRHKVVVHTDSFRTHSINYNMAATFKESGRYLADLFCSAVKDYIYADHAVLRGDKNMLPLGSISKELAEDFNISKVPYVFEYAPEIKQLQKLFDAFWHDDMEKLLRVVRKISKRELGRYYLEIFNNLEVFSKSDFLRDENVRSALAYIQSQYIEGRYNETQIMAQWLYEQKEKKDGFGNLPQEKFALLELLLQTNQHLGKIAASLEYESMCDQIRSTIQNPELDLRYANRTISTLENEFAFDDALKKALEIHSARKTIVEALEIIYKRKPYYDIDLARITSKLASLYSFKKEYAQAITYFQEALVYIPPIDNANRKIALSYYLHMAIESGNRHLYEQYECEYFGVPEAIDRAEKLNCIYESLTTNVRQVNAYAVFVFLKAVYNFYTMDEDFRIHYVIQQIAKTDWRKCGYNIEGHPFELINYYMVCFNDMMGNESGVNNNIEKLFGFCNKEATIAIISRALVLRYMATLKDEVLISEAYENLKKKCVAVAEEYPRVRTSLSKILEDGSTVKQALECFTYMYA